MTEDGLTLWSSTNMIGHGYDSDRHPRGPGRQRAG
jgi:hypothetical protein